MNDLDNRSRRSFDKTSVSVVIPAHNEELLIRGTIQHLNQAFKELDVKHEIIVVDDGSTDRTADVAVALGAKIVTVDLRNIGAVRNAGARAAQFGYLIFVDADTLVPVTTLRATIETLRTGSIGGGALVELIDDERSIPWYKSWIFPLIATIWLKCGKWAAGCYMFCTAKAFNDMGGFPEQYFAAEEYFFSRNLKKTGKFVLLHQPVQTSPRKIHSYSLWQLLRFMIWPFLNPQGALKSRQGLELLYEDRRT